VSDDIGMRSVSSTFESRNAAVRFLSAGNDMLTVCAHWTDTERARVLAQAILDARRSVFAYTSPSKAITDASKPPTCCFARCNASLFQRALILPSTSSTAQLQRLSTVSRT
jgi:hypothetical protein